MKDYTCEGCGRHFSAERDCLHIVHERWPELYEYFARDFCIDLDRKRGTPDPPEKLYHKVFHSRNSFGRRITLCGPLHEETQEEYYVRWASQ